MSFPTTDASLLFVILLIAGLTALGLAAALAAGVFSLVRGLRARARARRS